MIGEWILSRSSVRNAARDFSPLRLHGKTSETRRHRENASYARTKKQSAPESDQIPEAPYPARASPCIAHTRRLRRLHCTRKQPTRIGRAKRMVRASGGRKRAALSKKGHGKKIRGAAATASVEQSNAREEGKRPKNLRPGPPSSEASFRGSSPETALDH